jgi:hypothetical protein
VDQNTLTLLTCSPLGTFLSRIPDRSRPSPSVFLSSLPSPYPRSTTRGRSSHTTHAGGVGLRRVLALVESEAFLRAFSPGSTLEPRLKAFRRRGLKWQQIPIAFCPCWYYQPRLKEGAQPLLRDNYWCQVLVPGGIYYHPRLKSAHLVSGENATRD